MKRTAILLAAALVLGSANAWADGGPCGSPPPCKKERSCCSWFKKKKDCVEKECIRVPDTKKKTHTEYKCIEEDICKPWCHFCKKAKCGGCVTAKCDDCDKGGKCKDCGKVRCRRKLVKRFVVEEECTTKCI